MKKSSIARIIVLVLSLALLIGSAMAITAVANEESADGTFGGISTGYGDKVYIRVEVKATEEQINNGSVVVSYKFADEEVTKTATYFNAPNLNTTEGYVWVITEGIAAYDMARQVVFSSTVNGEQVEANRTYSVAQFLYKMLYTNNELTEEYRNMYEALLEYGRTAQIALNRNADKLITDSTLVTGAANITFGGKDFAFAPAGNATVTPTWNGEIADDQEIVGWKVLVNNEEQVVKPTFTVSGIVEVLEPVFGSNVDIWDGVSASESLTGSGTEEDPFLIQSGADLAYIDQNCTATENFKGVYFKMTKNIDLNGNSMKIGEYPGWSGRIIFSGIFDGNNYYIKNLNMTESGKGAGLFSVVKGTVKNLTVYGNVKGDGAMTGGIVGWLYKENSDALNTATLENCVSYVNVTSTGATETGGLVGTCQGGTIINCQNYGRVIGQDSVGGIAGKASGTITGCDNYGTVGGTSNVDGIYGSNHSSGTPVVENSTNHVSAWDGATATQPEGEGTEEAPYLVSSGENLLWIEQQMTAVGDNFGDKYFKMTNDIDLGGNSMMIGACPGWGTRRAFKGDFDGNGFFIVNLNINDTTGKATGLFGMVTGTVQNLTVQGTVKGTGQPIGGIVGYLRNGTIENCVSYVNVSSTGGASEVGGMVGTSENGKLINCVNYGSVNGTTSVGGIVGTASGTIEGCAFYGSFTGTASTKGDIYGAKRSGTLTVDGTAQ